MNVSIARTALRRVAGVSTMRRVVSPPYYLGSLTNSNSKTLLQSRHFSVATTIKDLLQHELDEEIENRSTAMPSDLEALQKKINSHWTIVDDDTTGTVKMFSKAPTAAAASPKVSIIFHCQDTLEAEYDEEQEGEESVEPAVAVRFSVTATKAGKTMVFSCLTEHAEASVETVAITADVERAQATGKVETDLYQGPEFTELAVELQDAFNDYIIEDCGVNEDVAAFISMYADYKEQNEYVKWLKQAQTIIS